MTQRIFLFLFVVACITKLQAQPGPLAQPSENLFWLDPNYPWVDGDYSAWSEVHENYLISFQEDSAWSVPGVSGLTDFSNNELSNIWSHYVSGYDDRYILDVYNDNMLSITFDPKVSAWANFSVRVAQTRNNYFEPSYPVGTNMGDFMINGYSIDMRDYNNFSISGYIKIPADFFLIGEEGERLPDQFTIRASVVDAHGHEWCSGLDPFTGIDIADFGTFQYFEINYFDLISDGVIGDDHPWGYTSNNPGDGWSSPYGLTRPIATDPEIIPIDIANIVAVRFYFEPGEGYGGMPGWEGYIDANVAPSTILMKDIVIGNRAEAVPYALGTNNETPEDTTGNGTNTTYQIPPLSQPEDNLYWLAEDYPWVDGDYSAWSEVYEEYLISFQQDSAWSVNGVSGLTDFSNIELNNVWSSPQVMGEYRYILDIFDNNTLSITFDPKISGWSAFSARLTETRNINGEPDFPVTTSLSDYMINGYSVDMRDNENFSISGFINIASNFLLQDENDERLPGKFTIRASVVDAHGHEWCSGLDPFAGIDPEDFGSFQYFEINYNDLIDASEIGDDHPWGYTDNNPGDGWINPYSLPRPIGTDRVRIPIDIANIVEVRFYFEPGEGYGGMPEWTSYIDANVPPTTILMRDIVIGDRARAVPFTPNHAPVVETVLVRNSINDITVNENFGRYTLNLNNYFTTTPAGGSISYSAQVDNTMSDIVEVGVYSGNFLYINSLDAGTGSVPITVTAQYGNSTAIETFNFIITEETVTINNAPRGINVPQQIQLVQGFGTHSLDLNDLFTDEDGDELEFYVNCYDDDIITTSLTSNNSIIITEGNTLGRAFVFITATDNIDVASVSIEVSVTTENNQLPVAISSNTTIVLSQASSTIDLNEYFTDDDDDILSYSTYSEFANIFGSSMDISLPINNYQLYTIPVLANDNNGGYAHTVFFVSHYNPDNNDIVIENTPRPVRLNPVNTSSSISLNDIFSDTDGDNITYSVILDNNNIASYSISNDTLYFEGLSLGSTNATIIATDNNGSIVSTSFALEFSNSTSIEYSSIDNTIAIYPTVAHSTLYVNCDNDASVAIYNSQGVKVFAKDNIQTTESIDVSKLSSGVYYINIDGTNKMFIKH